MRAATWLSPKTFGFEETVLDVYMTFPTKTRINIASISGGHFLHSFQGSFFSHELRETDVLVKKKAG